MKNNYWLYLEPYVFISIKAENVLLYNTLNGKKLEYSNNALVSSIVKRLNSAKNSYVIKLSENDIDNCEINDFIKKIKKYYIGDILKSTIRNKPFQLKPILNFQKNVKTIKKNPDLSVGSNQMQNLHELTIFINNECKLNCSNCIDSFKQFSFCSKNLKTSSELNAKQIEKVIGDIKGSSIQKISITGGNILDYLELEELNCVLDEYSSILEFNIHYQNIYNNIDKIKYFNQKSLLNILIDFPFNSKVLKSVNELIQIKGLNAKFSFVINSENDFSEIEKNIQELNIENYVILPYFNKTNMSFFRNNVFIKKRNIFEAKPSQNEIFSRHEVNPISFGKLYITNDGTIYSNLNNSSLGNIHDISIYEAVYKEMYNGKSWRKLRINVRPCNNCTYNQLCPPISNYEYVIGKYNLCNVRN